MIHANIDSVVGRNILGFEIGTRQVFDKRHGGDPLWVFLDSNIVTTRIRFDVFLHTPTLFYLDNRNNVFQGTVQTPLPIVGKLYLIDPDGAYLIDSDGAYLTESLGQILQPPPPPSGQVYVVGSDGSYLVDSSGNYVTETA